MQATRGQIIGIGGRPELSLLGGFSLRVDDHLVALPLHARRVLAYLALDKTAEPDCARGVLAERLWPDCPVDRCRASLRTALWRIRRAGPDLLSGGADRVGVADAVVVDIHLYRHEAERLLDTGSDSSRNRTQLMARTTELLPGWDESWLVLAREQLRQLRLHALEVDAYRLIDGSRYPEAIDVMLAVIAEEPLRESAQAALIGAHLAEGNVFEARRQFEMFAAVLWTELGVRPSIDLYATVGAIPPAPAQRPPGRGRVRRDPTEWQRRRAAMR